MSTQPRFIPLAMAVEGSLVLLAVVLAYVLNVSLADGLDTPWVEGVQAVVLGALASLPLVVGALVLMRVPWRGVQRLRLIVRDQLMPLFASANCIQLAWVSLLAGIGEELLFRGVLQPWLGNAMGAPWLSVLVVALIFGICHALTVTYAVLATLMGIYFGWLYLATGWLLAPMVCHFLYDWIMLSYLQRRSP